VKDEPMKFNELEVLFWKCTDSLQQHDAGNFCIKEKFYGYDLWHENYFVGDFDSLIEAKSAAQTLQFLKDAGLVE
jgi:hypothetical protein